MEALLQLFVLIIATFLLTACGTVAPRAAVHTAAVEAVSDELSCMTDCLADGSETCESCAADCLDRSAAGHVASGE